jgi:hypothetical protein
MKGGGTMGYTFVIEPLSYIAFEDEMAQLEQCKEWGLLSKKASKTKTFFYKGYGMNLACSIVGLVDKITAVIEFETKQLHCMHPSYLKEMQAASYGLKPSAEGTSSAEPENMVSGGEALQAKALIEAEAGGAQLEEVVSKAELSKNAESGSEVSQADEPIVDISEPEDAQQSKTKKTKKQKLELPEGKVKMTATVKEFTTVPNHFSDNDDEVVIYEAVSMIEPETEIGEAWSSHSATLKKLELALGDTITFEAKIVAKKLTKHPVSYKINNPAKIQKE